jgi:hypothetical protein
MNFLQQFIEEKEKEKQTFPSPITDPFKSDKIKKIFIIMSDWGGRKYWYGKIEFNNNRTSGEYKTQEYPVDQFQECVKDIENTIKSL